MTNDTPQPRNQNQQPAQNQVQQTQPQGQQAQKWYERPWYLNPISLGLLTIAGVFGACAAYIFATSPKEKENIEYKVQECEIAGRAVPPDDVSKEVEELANLIRDMEAEENKYENKATGPDGKYPQSLIEKITEKIDYNKDRKITLEEIERARKIVFGEDNK